MRKGPDMKVANAHSVTMLWLRIDEAHKGCHNCSLNQDK